MSFRLTRLPRTAQPQERAGPNPDWLSRRLAYLWGMPNGSSNVRLLNLVDGTSAASQDANNDFETVPTRAGLAGRNRAGTSAGALHYLQTTPALSGLQEFSMLAWFIFGSADENAQWLNFRTDNQHTLDVWSKTSTSLTWGADWAGAWNGVSQQTLSGLVDGDFVCIGASITQSGCRFFANGSFSGTKSGSGFTTSSSSVSVTRHTRARHLGAAMFRAALSDAEMQAITANPWQLFEDEIIFVPASAPAPGTTDGVGASVGVATASATSQATWAVVGASTAAPTVTATSQTVVAAVASSIATAGASSQSQALWAGVGTSVATSDALADGIDAAAGITAAVGASAGAATASATARAIWAGVGDSVGAATALATGTDAASGFAEATGSSVGTSTAAATGRAVWAAAGATPGGPDALGVSQSIHFRAATSTGVATATADGTEVSAYEPRTVTSAGASLADAVSRTVVAAVGSAAGSAVALAASDVLSSVESGVGVAVAAATAAAVAQAVWAAVGASTGSSTAEGFPPTSLPAGAVLSQVLVRTINLETQVRLNSTTIHVTV